MNSETMNNLLLYLTDVVKQGVEFSAENIPIWINQILMYKTFVHSFSLAFFSVLLLTTFLVFLKFRKRIEQLVRYDDNAAIFYILFAGCWALSALVIFCSISTLVMINVAPMYYLMKLMNIVM